MYLFDFDFQISILLNLLNSI